jgi:hypothetical protein
VTTTTLKSATRCTGGHFMHPGDRVCGCGAIPRITRHPLPRHDTAQTCEIAADRAAAKAVGARLALLLPIRVIDWRGHADGTATQTLPGGITIRYQPAAPRPFEVAVPCIHGAHHYRTITTATDLADAIAEADVCMEQHADFTGWATAAARDLSAAFAPRHIPGTATVIPLRARGGVV